MRIGLFITARMKSTRLPFKLLKDLNGFSIIEHVIKRSQKIKGIDEIVLCTSNNPQDKPLTDVAIENGIHYFLGSEQDVLERLFQSSRYFGLDYILSITGENPLFSIDIANRMVDMMKRENHDFSTVDGAPVGAAVYGIKVKALELVCKIKTEIDTEIWGILFNQPEIFSIGKIQVEDFLYRPSMRLTNDFPEDYRMMSKIFHAFPYKSLPSLLSVLEYLDNNPSTLEINSKKQQASLDPEVVSRVNSFYKENKKKILDIKKEIYLS
ncbi:hypothetical protein KZP23_21760 [Echinicola marina]|uniref:cytidylyltransferase domain-containing protein n=1 Tax=Echinicola marina TaxID=2859768 RepID=UPI001CF693FA|nr:hypothetical protein [Echinicola marina]UCS93244.1 hypothetical protein KZP23_21760 [Echinicola marina]